MDNDNIETRVLSIQSWVCHGYVGNKCAVMALQHLGIDVDPINTVQLSNNTAYTSFKGESLSAAKLLEIFETLQHNKLANYTHLLTGYNNNAETLRTVLSIVKKLKESNPNLIYVCDPVLGDNNALYVPENLVAVYRDEVIIHADYLFPNQTEAEYLTGIKISSQDDAIRAIDSLHDKGIANVIITSCTIDNNDEDIVVIGSRKGERKFRLSVKKFDGYYSGTGDTFSALLLGYCVEQQQISGASKTQISLASACEQAVTTLYNIIKLTHNAKQLIPSSKLGEYHELKLIQSRHFIGNKQVQFPSTYI
ncbi:pyridoxal kinase [Heterostelium album PN500]|uniref:pyridoxal kinase n=1 Tax=Heterostelium pallidum (strain ATCC 26659 / Pp 5 / PN500) TaxID=670386 RepID=D3BBZ9_HETP5|nr:pyridoxal kinase [Heterostelium album PN500]EFA81182.1 pyridoxal kinase [Heterostelium album PN500]|eukprot:XP_020433300.1 pyridoxal kinase [Heterostelium album PN500]